MAPPHEAMLRQAYAVFAQGDLAGYLALCAPDITFRVPGRGLVAGTYTREQFFTPFISTVVEGSGGTFRETVLDVIANDTRGVVVARHELQRGGRTHSYQTLHLYRFDRGKLTDFEEYPEDIYAFDQVWAR